MTYTTYADLGGTQGHGPIVPEPEGVVFHHRWQSRVLTLVVAGGASGKWNIDMSRRFRETLPNYLDLTYYEIWTAGLEPLLVDRGMVTDEELAAGHALTDAVEVRDVLTADRVASAMASGKPAQREVSWPARFAVGERVLTRSGHVDHHTRLPQYVAGRVGTVERSTAPTCSPTPTPTTSASSRSGCTRSCSTPPICGMTRRPGSGCRSTPGSRTCPPSRSARA